MPAMTHLGIVDGAFLHLETPDMPMHVASLTLLAPPAAGATGARPWFDVLKDHLAARVHLAAPFTRKLAAMPLGLANPVWVVDEDFDIDHHVQRRVLPNPGTRKQLDALVATLHEAPLDRSRPLWQAFVIEGLDDGRIGYYAKVHHAAADGQAAVAMAGVVFDLTPVPRDVPPPRARRRHAAPSTASLLGAALGHQAGQMVGVARWLRPLAGAGVKALKQMLNEALAPAPRAPAAAPADALPKGQGGLLSKLKQAPPSPFNHPVTPQRSFATLSLPLAELRALGRAHGASLNDMVLWLSATALREHLRAAKHLPEQPLVAFVPISLRSPGDASSNNQVSATLIDLGTPLADPLQRLAAIMAGTQAMKSQISAFGKLIPKDLPSMGAPWLLSALVAMYSRARLADRLRVANVAISNVPGPPVPLYLAGARVEGIYPLSIVVHGVALNITVQSYDGQLCFGITACKQALPQAEQLARRITQAFELLRTLPAPAPPVPACEPEPPASATAPKRGGRKLRV